MNEFENTGFVILRNVLAPQTVSLLSTEFKMLRDVDKHQSGLSDEEYSKVADEQVPNSFYWYGAFCFESLMLVLQKTVEDIIDKSLFPCYTYARIMGNSAIMKKHKDRPSCQYSVTICIEEDEKVPYPIFMENYNGDVSEVFLHAGDMIVYHGTKLYHWRKKFKGVQHIQAFLHYVDANGLYKDYKYDKRILLGTSK